jgi:hypothetical protein
VVRDYWTNVSREWFLIKSEYEEASAAHMDFVFLGHDKTKLGKLINPHFTKYKDEYR